MNPVQLVERLEAIDADLAARGPELEEAARLHFIAKRDMEKARAKAFVEAKGTDQTRKALSIIETADMGKIEEANYEALKAVVRTLETRASIGQTLTRVNGRGA